MLDGYLCSLFWPRVIVQGILLTSFLLQPVYGISYADGADDIPQHMEQEWVCRYFDSINENISVEEVIDFLVSLKASFMSKG